ncbi:MAG: thioredoxin family protein [Cytophagales bacterium]|jgi:thioredoxin-like negative regulator of GroEL|nr:thioredoxin family protein [Cytophagales bacterium]
MKKITETDFADMVIQADGVQVVHFHNPYSDYSNHTYAILKELYETNADANFFQINLLQCESLCERYGISTPVVLIFEDGVLQDIMQDFVSKDVLAARLAVLSANAGT